MCATRIPGDAWAIKNDLVFRGVDSTAFELEIRRNTRQEAMEVINCSDAPNKSCLIITAPGTYATRCSHFPEDGL
ncbi:MAG: hypothetical protein IPN36_06890 [Bacteroidetes bacterium]|nr:hypothetical protein [Bacteroidota bacterium]